MLQERQHHGGHAGSGPYVKWGATNKNYVVLGSTNIFEKAALYAEKNLLSRIEQFDFLHVVNAMLHTNKYRLSHNWAANRHGFGMDPYKINLLWMSRFELEKFTTDKLADLLFDLRAGKAWRYWTDTPSQDIPAGPILPDLEMFQDASHGGAAENQLEADMLRGVGIDARAEEPEPIHAEQRHHNMARNRILELENQFRDKGVACPKIAAIRAYLREGREEHQAMAEEVARRRNPDVEGIQILGGYP